MRCCRNFHPKCWAVGRFLKHVLVSGATAAHPGLRSLGEVLAGCEETCEAAATWRDEACFWLYSSGSTGVPKGTVHVHSSLIETAALYAQGTLGLQESDVALSAAKLFFAYGLGNSLTFPLAVGATSVLMAERATPAAIVSRLRLHRPTVFSGVPTLYASLLASGQLPPPQELTLRICNSAGEALPADIARRWRERTGVDIVDGIGSTEMLHIFISNRPDRIRPGTLGLPVPGYEVKIVDDAGNPVAAGDTGDLLVRGPSSAKFYWNQEARSRATFVGSWTRTGDRFCIDASGDYIYAGRADDMLKVGGIYVSPIEVEAALSAHPAVHEAAVVGKEDCDRLIKPMAFIVLAAGHFASETLSQRAAKASSSRGWLLINIHGGSSSSPTCPRPRPARSNGCKIACRMQNRTADADRISGCRGRRIEYRFVQFRPGTHCADIVMLHEGLGSVSQWRDFPEHLAQATGCRVLVYSRHGHGGSSPLDAPRLVDYMHEEARVWLPAILLPASGSAGRSCSGTAMGHPSP